LTPLSNAPCRNCDGEEWVCENHLDHPWDGVSSRDDACGCGAGAPCPVCRPDLSNAHLLNEFERAIGMIEDAEHDTNFVSGDPYGDSATVGLRETLANARQRGGPSA
jgi:hypothetical protein